MVTSPILTSRKPHRVTSARGSSQRHSQTRQGLRHKVYVVAEPTKHTLIFAPDDNYHLLKSVRCHPLLVQTPLLCTGTNRNDMHPTMSRFWRQSICPYGSSVSCAARPTTLRAFSGRPVSNRSIPAPVSVLPDAATGFTCW